MSKEVRIASSCEAKLDDKEPAELAVDNDIDEERLCCRGSVRIRAESK